MSVCKISIRNKLKGVVEDIKVGEVLSEVTIKIDGQKVVSIITKDVLEELGLKVGDEVIALIKATHVAIAKPTEECKC